MPKDTQYARRPSLLNSLYAALLLNWTFYWQTYVVAEHVCIKPSDDPTHLMRRRSVPWRCPECGRTLP